MSALEITSENFEAEVKNAELPVVVDFWATWCGPCQLQGPELEKFQSANEGKVITAKINVDDQPQLASQFGVQSIPTLILFKNGEEADRAVGLQSADNLTAKFLG